jgi:hypothetical protein
MPRDARDQELHRGDEVTVRMRVVDVVSDSERANLLLNFDAPVPGFPEEWRLMLPSSRVELAATAHQREQVQQPADATAGTPGTMQP